MRKIVSLCLMLVMSMMIWADRTLYFVPNSDWTQANAKFAVYCFENEESEWSDFMTLVAGETNVYTTTIPDSYTQVIFCRMNSAATECNWGSKWNQSADITLPTDGKDMFTLADGWDQMSGTWSIYAAPQQQDTTNVSPLADKHFYLNGDFINWETQKALEFTLADSLFTLTVDTLSGTFKVMTARNWEAPDYGGDYDVNLTLGVPYTLTERGYNLSCSTIYLNAELQLRLVGNDVILTLAAGTPVQQDTTGTNPQDTTQVEMITYYAVNTPRWSLPYAYVWDDVLGAYRTWPGEVMDQTGINFRGYEVYSYTMPKEYTMMIINNGKGGDNNQTPDMQLDTTLRYMYDLQWYASLDSIPAEQQDTTGTNPQDTTSVTPEVEHYYLIGAFNEWNVETALEFFNLDSFYTLKTASLEGEFKILTARSWDATNYGAANVGDQLVPGDEYELNSNSAPNLSVNGAYTNVILTLTKANDILKLHFAAGTPVQQDTTGTNPQDTTIVPPVVEKSYYIKNNWNGGEWTWQPMVAVESVNEDTTILLWGYTDVFGGTGVNINTAASDQDALWFAVESFQLADGSLVPQAMDTVLFIYNNEANTLTATVIGRPSVEPQPQEETHYYMVGQFNDWDVATAPEFAMQDSIYTITIDTMAGDFKIVGARDWTHGEYGAAAQGDVIDLGGTYTLATPGAPNLSVNGTYTNATFKLAKNGVNLVLYFAAGTPVQQDTTGTNPQDTTIVPPVVNDITVYTVMPEGWSALNAYIWIGNQGYVTWPGEAMTNTGETFRGDTVYSYTFPETYTSIIFNNGNGEQTIDLTIDTTKLYYYGETWYASWDEVPEEVIILPATYYVSGNENLVTAAGLSPDYAWNAAAIKATSDTLVLNLRANTDYKLRLTLNGTWVSDVKNYYYLTEVTPGLTTDIEANICFTPAEDGPVTIIYNDSVFTVQGNFIVFAKPTYYIKNNWEAGADWTWQQMDAIDNDSIYWGYVGVFGGTGVNIATEGSDYAPSTWFDASSFIVEGDLIPQPLDTVYFVFDALRETLTAAVINRPGGVEPQPLTSFYLVGQFNGWDLETAPEFARQDSFVYTMTVDTLFGAMKVVVSRDSWEGNYGVADMNDAVLTMGQTKALVPYLSGISDNFNFSVEGIILNAVLNIVVTDNVVNITLVSGTPYVTPAENRHFYMTGAFNDWNVETALEFVYADSVYTLTIDTIYGEFKVTDARDWLHGIYGAYNIGDVLNLGNEYEMAAMNSQNLSLITTYTNVTLNLRVENNVVTIIFVSGTQIPTTGLDTTVGNTATPVKLIENGALIILRDGVKYNAAGQRIR